ncbi:hypothetical protein BTVI_83363 [Pitangus sulphuratus]|nr:hypothetical protein BTVI_83363 [Pitangus sulphuratus]
MRGKGRKRHKRQESGNPRSGQAEGYNMEEDGAQTREGRISSTGTTNHQEPSTLSTDHMNIPQTHAKSFRGLLDQILKPSSRTTARSMKDQGGLSQLPVDPEIVQNLLLQLDPYKSMGADVIHPRILKELLMSSQNLFMIFERSWKSREVPADWKLANVLIFKKQKKEDTRNYRPISVTSVPGEVMEKIILGSIEKDLKALSLVTASTDS